MRKVAFAIVVFSMLGYAQAASLEAQVSSLEASGRSADAIRAAAIKEIDSVVLKGYAETAKILVRDPTIESIDGDTVRVNIRVDYQVPKTQMSAISGVLRKYLKVTPVDSEVWYSFNHLCYKQGGCMNEVISPATPDAWRRMSERALVLEVSFLGESNFGVVIGQTTGTIGKVVPGGYFVLTFDVPKSRIKGDPKASARLELYKCKWHYKDPQYSRIRT